MLLLYSLTSYQPDPKSKKSFPWFLLRFTSSNGLPAAVLQASAEEQCLVTLNIAVIAQWGSTEMICLDLVLGRRPLQPFHSANILQS
jgi:hypothetical protein